MQKQYVIERKDWLDEAVATFWPHRMLERLKSALKIEIAEGYEDEAGFHYGSQPAVKDKH